MIYLDFEKDMKITRTVVQKEELTDLNRLQNDFLRTILHELRTHVINMTMAMPMLTVALGQGNPSQQIDRWHRHQNKFSKVWK